MASPAEMTVKNLKGKFALNKTLSDSMDPIIALQGVPYLLRKILLAAHLSLEAESKQMEPTEAEKTDEPTTEESKPVYDVTLTSAVSSLGPFGLGPLRAAGINTSRVEYRKLDGTEVKKVEPVVGSVRESWWMSTATVLADEPVNEFLKTRKNGSEDVIRVTMKGCEETPSKAYGVEHVWGFEESTDGLVRYTGRIAISKGDQKACATQIYDYISAN